MLIGSSLHTLELGRGHTGTSLHTLLYQMVVNDANMRLRRLWLSNEVNPYDPVLLGRFLSQTSTLRDLRLVWPEIEQDFQPVLVPSFRAKGSLSRVRVSDENNETNPALFRAFCARNTKLEVHMRAYGCDNESDAQDDDTIGTPPISLAPSLCAVAQQTPRTAASIILTGLLALSVILPNSIIQQVLLLLVGDVRSDKLRLRV
jgi:hypothetical protein